MTDSTGSTALNASTSAAPTMIARDPSAAPIGPPETGASMTSTAKPHTDITCFCSSAGVAGATVEWMTKDTGTKLLRGLEVGQHLGQHRAHLVVVAHHHADDVGPVAHRADGLGGRRTGRDQLGDGLGVDVEDLQVDRLAGRQPLGHGLADVAQPDEARSGSPS